MSDGDANTPFRIGAWLVQPSLNRLSDGDHVITLEPRVMSVLVCLTSWQGKIVSARDLLDTVWHGRAHADNTIYQAVTDLRKALGDDVRRPRYIQTIAKKGYRLICPVTPVAADTKGPGFALHRRRYVAITAGIASIAVAIILIAGPQIRDRLLPTDVGPSDRSVAVLPFVDMSEDGNFRYLADGVSEELIHLLSNLPELRVIARTSSFSFRDSNEDIRQIGSKLNVATILEGSIRKDGDRIRITSQLVDTSNGQHLWSHTFDRNASDLFRVQKEIAVAVARTFEYREMDVLVADDLVARPIELQTYDFYLLGLYQLRKDTPSGYVLAIQYFERAIEMDPGFARAYAGLAECYVTQYWYERDQELLDKAEFAAEYALLLDDQSAEAFEALGYVKAVSGDVAGSEKPFLKAVELNPNDMRAYGFLLDTYESTGRQDEADLMLQKALELNPMSAELNFRMGHYYYRMPDRDWDTAFEHFKRTMDLDPDYHLAYGVVGSYYRSIGQLDQAIPYFRKQVDLSSGPTKASLHVGNLTSVYVDIGYYELAAQVIRQTKELEPNHFGAINSEIHLQLARGNFSAARDIVHNLLPRYIDKDTRISLMAFYELVIGDTDHAEEIYARLAAAQVPHSTVPEANLYRGNELRWGMMGAVNLAYLHKRNGETLAAQQLLGKAREFVERRRNRPIYVSSIPYVLAQIAAVEGNNGAAIEYVREAVEAGWTRVWFGRIDPIMADLREDTRYLQLLDELEDKLIEMREHPKMMASK
jgi:TolB-like protein/DNA-binding winged helix-turn-helix (wHTH) protein/Tfp pilus assembly protein PilF